MSPDKATLIVQGYFYKEGCSYESMRANHAEAGVWAKSGEQGNSSDIIYSIFNQLILLSGLTLPMPSVLLPEITSQINYLHQRPCLRFCSQGHTNEFLLLLGGKALRLFLKPRRTSSTPTCVWSRASLFKVDFLY